MLQITIPETELYDEERNVFFTVKAQVLTLEHSLVSISKWESKWKKAFLTNKEKTNSEIADYVRCMTLTQNVDPNVYLYITSENIKMVSQYIEDSMTATTFLKKENQVTNREVITSELIYYWMITLNVPFECQKWHLNRLLTLINVCNIKNQPKEKRSQRDLINQNRALNAARRKQYNTSG